MQDIDNQHSSVQLPPMPHRVNYRVIERYHTSLLPPMPFTTHDQVHHVRLRDVDTEVQPQVATGDSPLTTKESTTTASGVPPSAPVQDEAMPTTVAWAMMVLVAAAMCATRNKTEAQAATLGVAVGFAASALTGQVKGVAIAARRAAPINPVLAIILLCLVTGSHGQSDNPSAELPPPLGMMHLFVTGLCAVLSSMAVHALMAMNRPTRNTASPFMSNADNTSGQHGSRDKPPAHGVPLAYASTPPAPRTTPRSSPSEGRAKAVSTTGPRHLEAKKPCAPAVSKARPLLPSGTEQTGTVHSFNGETGQVCVISSHSGKTNFHFDAKDILGVLSGATSSRSIANGMRVSFRPTFNKNGRPTRAVHIEPQPTASPDVRYGHTLADGTRTAFRAVANPQDKLAPRATITAPPAVSNWSSAWDSYAMCDLPSRNDPWFDIDPITDTTSGWPDKCPQAKHGHSLPPQWCPQDKLGRHKPYLTAM